jgi:hypothetical protein
MILLSYRIARLAFGPRSGLPLVVSMFLAVNPSLLAIASSIENDMLAIVLSLLLTLCAAKWMNNGVLSYRHSLLLGGLASAAILTKLTTAFWIPTLPLLMLWHYRGRGIPRALVYLLTIFACCGWWFARNYSLYGDITGGSAMKYYVSVESIRPVKLWTPSIFLRWIRSLVTYYWLPYEYYRNVYRPPRVVTFGVVGLTIAAAVGFAGAVIVWCRSEVQWRKLPPVLTLLGIQYLSSIALYAHAWMTATPLGARMTLPTVIVFAIVFWIGLFSLARSRPSLRSASGQTAILAGVWVFMLLTNCCVLYQYHSIVRLPFHIQFR